MKQVDLDVALLGPDFRTQTPQSFVDYVRSLKQLRSVDKPVKVPRVKKEKLTHKFAADGKTCERCGKKPRKETAQCSGKLTTSNLEEKSVDGETVDVSVE
jgi:hypothetical protein